MSLEMPPSPPSLLPPERGAELPHHFSSELRELMVRFEHRPVRLMELFDATKGRGYHMLLMLICLPFVTPLPLPGISIPFGVAVTVLGARLALGLHLWLPPRVLRWQLPAHSLARVVGMASWVMQRIEYFVRPRMSFVGEQVVFSRISGLLIAFSGLMLMLPFPLPLSNSLPAWTVLLFSAGTLGRDGLYFFAGCVSFVLSVAYFAFVAVGSVHATQKLWQMWMVTHGG